MLRDAVAFWESISGKVKQLVKGETKNAFRTERYEVTTAPNGTKIGVTLPLGSKEIFLPYSSEVASATVGDPVMVVWWGSMSNAKVYYYADGYRGGLAAYPVGSIYMSVNNVSPAAIFGGTWEQLKDTFLLAAGDDYSAGTTGGSADAVLVSHNHRIIGGENGTTNLHSAGAVYSGSTSAHWGAWFGSGYNGWDNVYATTEGESGTGKNMPPYLTVYMWKRIA